MRIALAALLLAGSALADESLTLESAQRLAVQNSPLMRAARQSLAAFEAQYREAWWAWWPRMDVKLLTTGIPPQAEGAVNRETVFALDDPTREIGSVRTGPDLDTWNFWMRLNVDVVAPLFTFGKLSTLKEMAEHGVEVGHAAERLAEGELRFQVARAWHGLGLAAELDALIADGQEKLDKARKRLEKLEEEDSPDFDQADLFRMRIYEAQVKKLVLGNKHFGELSRTGLRVALGLGKDAPLALPTPMVLSPVEAVVGGIDCYVDLAARQRPELQMKRHEAAVKAIEVDRKWADFWPDFFLAGNFTYAYSTVDQLDTAFSSTVFNALGGAAALGLRMDLDYPGKVARYDRAQADAERLKAEVEVAEAQLRVELDDTWRNANDQQEMLATNERAMRASRSLLVLRSQEYENGVDDSARFKDVLDAAVSYLQQKSEWLNTVHAFNGAMIRLTRLVGEDVTRYRCPVIPK